MTETINAVSLFAGAGGLDQGLADACQAQGYDLDLVAINHWEQAIASHERNHPDAEQYHSKVEQLHPPNVVDDAVDILLAGPECTHFSKARGGKPVDEQQRASPWHVVDWLEKLDVQTFIIENVPELEDWGPVDDGRPTRNGEIFEAWIDALHALGYSVDWATLNAADYGDPTSRERLFIVGRQDHRATFPAPTHSDDDPALPDRRPAAEIINWSEPGGSIWTRDLHDGRKTPPASTTMQRIAEGVRRHCADVLEPFADVLASLGPDEIRSLRETVVPESYAAIAARALDAPFLVATDATTTLAHPYLLRQQSGGVPSSVARPLPTISTKAAIGKIEPRPLIMPKNGRCRGVHSNSLYRPEDRPFHVVTSDPRAKLVTPYLTPLNNGRDEQRPRTRAVDRPLMTVPASKSPAAVTTPLVRPFIDDYQGPAADVGRPLGTVTARDRFALVVPSLYPWGLDIRYRMLQPRELKQAQGFPPEYELVGTKRDRNEQIGNAVPVHLAQALVEHLLTDDAPSLTTYTSQEVGADD